LFLGTEEEENVPSRYLPIVFLLVGACLLVAAASRWPWLADDRARLAVNWMSDRGDYAYRLRGRYSIASVSEGYVTSISNDTRSDATASYIDVPVGLYRVTLEPGYTLERFVSPSADAARRGLVGDSVEVVPASLVSPNPVLVMATEGHIAPLRPSLVDMPGTATEPEATCMNGS
jgi:hypothetical protein